jgi:restriction system protein
MAVPDFQTLMLPLLKLLGDGREHRFSDAVEALADEFGLSEDERAQMLPSGRDRLIRNRVGWARTYLGKAVLLRAARRGFLQITDRGREVLASNPGRVDMKFLERFPEFLQFRELRHERSDAQAESAVAPVPETLTDATPEETLDVSYQRLRGELESDVLDQVKACSPPFFERLVVELLVKMGYGGSLLDAGQAVGRSGDGGIDGIIKEDRLGLDVIYLQAKRWDSSVSRPEIQKFAGALQGHRARKGVFITTSGFTREALEFAKSIESKIVLIDGTTLARLMVDHDLGVATVRSYEIKRIDSDYFSEE